MNEQAAIERLSETENLTGGLDDEPANLLLNWAYRRVPGLLASARNEAAAFQKVNGLMAVMRQISKITLSRAGPALEVASELQELARLCTRMYGFFPRPEPAELQSLALEIAGQTGVEAISTLLAWLTPADQSAPPRSPNE